MSAQAYDLMECPARSRASRPVAMPPQISTREIALSGRGHVGSWTREGSLGQQSVVSPSGGGNGGLDPSLGGVGGGGYNIISTTVPAAIYEYYISTYTTALLTTYYPQPTAYSLKPTYCYLLPTTYYCTYCSTVLYGTVPATVPATYYEYQLPTSTSTAT